MNRRDLRIRRFKTFATNLSFYEEKLKDKFLCPFCERLFTIEDIDKKPDDPNFLVGAHVVPYSVSDTMRTTMSCFSCDNWFGTYFNSHESRRHRIRRMMGAGRTTRFHAKMADKGRAFGVATFIHWEDNEPSVEFQHMIDLEPDKKEWFESHVRETVLRPSWDGMELGVDYYGRYSNRRADLSYWHSVYLHMFHHYGYEWVFSSWANKIKRQFEMAEFPVIPDSFLEPKLIPSKLLSEDVLQRRQPATFADVEQNGFWVVFPRVPPMQSHVGVFVPYDWEGAPAVIPDRLSVDITPEHRNLALMMHPLPFLRQVDEND